MPHTKQTIAADTFSPELISSDFERALEAAICTHEQGDLTEALKLYNALLKEHPNHAGALNAKAILLYQQDRVDDALPFAKKAIAAAPEKPEYLNTLGLIERNMRQPLRAIKTFKAALKIQPDYPEALSNIGLVYNDMQQPPKAVTYFKKALKFSPNHLDILLNLAHALRDCGKPEEAIIYYKKLVDLQPNVARYALNLAIMHHSLAQFDEAITYFERVVELDPSDIGTQHLLKATRGDKEASTVPDAYIADLFDTYANHFDYHLHKLGYNVPAMLAARIPVVVAPQTKRGQWNMLDLGCGTGVCGRLFKSECRHMIGVDLSEKMVEKAREHDVYDELHTTSIDGYFKNSTALFDLIFATDVLVYIGGLENLFQQVAEHLKPGGLFAFSTELCTADEGDYVLRNSGRFAHSDPYILRLSKHFDLRKMINADINVRMGHNEPIAGKLYILKK